MVSSALLRTFVQEPSISPNEQSDSLCARQDISASQFGFCPWYPRRFFGPSFKSLRFLRTNSRIHYVLAKILEHVFGFCPWYPRRFFGPSFKSLRFLRTNSRIHYVLAKILEHDFGFCPWYPRRFFGPSFKSLRFLRTNSRIHYVLAKILVHLSLGSVHGILGASSDLRSRAFDFSERTVGFIMCSPRY